LVTAKITARNSKICNHPLGVIRISPVAAARTAGMPSSEH
jgi:hypothetical protein